MTSSLAHRAVSPLFAATLLVLAASVAGQTVAGGQGSSGLYLFASAAFAGALLRLGWQLNAPWWQLAHAGDDIGPSHHDAQPDLANRNAELIALCYTWGGASLLAVYLLTPLRWQHGWQYGSGMALIAGLLFWGSRQLRSRWSPTVNQAVIWASLIHGWAATAGMGWMIGIGKIYSIKGDWAANIVFMTGGLTIVGITIMALRTSRFLAIEAAT